MPDEPRPPEVETSEAETVEEVAGEIVSFAVRQRRIVPTLEPDNALQKLRHGLVVVARAEHPLSAHRGQLRQLLPDHGTHQAFDVIDATQGPH